MTIVQQVLQNHMKLLYTCLHRGNPPDVIMTTLRLLTAMVTQGVTAAREVQRSFDFTLKAIGALPNKRDPKVSNMCPTEVRIVLACIASVSNRVIARKLEQKQKTG